MRILPPFGHGGQLFRIEYLRVLEEDRYRLERDVLNGTYVVEVVSPAHRLHESPVNARPGLSWKDPASVSGAYSSDVDIYLIPLEPLADQQRERFLFISLDQPVSQLLCLPPFQCISNLPGMIQVCTITKY